MAPATPPSCTSTAPANGDAGSYSTSCSDVEDPNYTISYASGTMTISQASTITVLTSTPDPSVFGQLVTLTATVSVVSPGAGNPTGTVEFKDGSTDIAGCASQPVGGGLATCTTSALAAGPHGIMATYGGDHNFTGSSGTVVQTVNARPALQLYISAPYQDDGVTVVSLWWTAPPGATSFSLTATESTADGPSSYTADLLPQYGPDNPFIVQVEGDTTLNSATFQVTDNTGDSSNIGSYP
jgi:large repetitive protein